MPRYNVKRKNQWACFSSITDSFITPFMSEEDFETWRDSEYGKNKGTLKDSNRMTYNEALSSMRMNKTKAEVRALLNEIGIESP